MNIIRIALIAPQEKDRQQLREQMFSSAVRWKVAVVTDCFDCLEEFAMAAQSGGYPVSYTHLDVYKRQALGRREPRWMPESEYLPVYDAQEASPVQGGCSCL